MTRRLDGPQSWSGCGGEREHPLTAPGGDRTMDIQPIAQSLF